jgi:hypothetical protein
MHFDFPQAFLLLIILLPLFWVLRRSEQRTRTIAGLFNSHTPRKSFFTLRAVFMAGFIGSMVVVAAKPYIEFGKTGDFMFLVDASRSMHARYTCGEPTFLDRAKHVMRDVLAGIPEARFSILAFDRFAFPITQMTYDQTYLNEVIEHVVDVGMTFEATKTELAIALAEAARKKASLPGSYGKVKNLILLSDGHISGDYHRSLSEPLNELRNAGIAVMTVGIGNPGETPVMYIERGRCLEEPIQVDGEVVLVPLRDDILRYIAGETKGQYFAESETDNLVRVLRENMQENTSVETAAGTAHRRDISWIFLGLGTLALFGLLFLATIQRFHITWLNTPR